MPRLILTMLAVASATLPAQPSAPSVRLVEDLRLDATAEDFPSVTRVYVGPGGQIVVPIAADLEARIYDASGKRIAVVGRRGSGPGEFTSMALVGWMRDTMWIIDGRQQRTSFFGPDFKLLRTTTWPRGNEASGTRLMYFSPLAYLADGGVLGQGVLQPDPGQTREPPAAVAHLTAKGVMRTVYSIPSANDMPSLMVIDGLYNHVPFALDPQYTFNGNGTRFVVMTAPIPTSPDGTFSVTMRMLSGDTVFSRSYPFRGVAIPKAAKDSALAAFLPPPGRAREGSADLPQRFQAEARRRMSDWYIPVQSVMPGLDHTTWIALRPTDSGRGYLILNGRGDLIGSLTVPLSTRVRQASGTHVWVTETDDDGLSSVVRYRVVGLNCGPPGC